jgi:hypothetical protein
MLSVDDAQTDILERYRESLRVIILFRGSEFETRIREDVRAEYFD